MVPVIKKAASDWTTKATIEANAHWATMIVAHTPGGPVVGSFTISMRRAVKRTGAERSQWQATAKRYTVH